MKVGTINDFVKIYKKVIPIVLVQGTANFYGHNHPFLVYHSHVGTLGDCVCRGNACFERCTNNMLK